MKMRAQGLSKRYPGSVALHPIDLEVRSGELLTLLGPSGSGKTTLLQLIAGLTDPTAGRIFIDDIDCTAKPASQRGIGVVFQSYALFPHLTVAENIGFPLKMRGTPQRDIAHQVSRVLELVGLGRFADRFPRALSGGQQQRVALARCLVYQPSLLLMDESLSALDRKLREAMQIEIKRIHRETGSTIIFVTHDQDEAMALSDRVCLMNSGRIEQIGTPQEIYQCPRTLFAADFIGGSNKFSGVVVPDGLLQTPDGMLPLPRDAAASRVGAAITLVVRPEKVRVAESDGLLVGTVFERIYAGSQTRVLVRTPHGTVVAASLPNELAGLEIGATVSLQWDRESTSPLAE